MNIAILHQDLEWSETKIKEEFEKQNISTVLVSINNEKVFDLCKHSDLVLNRVYASVANRNYSDIKKTLNLLDSLEKNEALCINSYETSLADYSKYYSYLKMKEAGVSTPETKLISEIPTIDELKQYVEYVNGFPLIIKRDTGGRGEDVVKIDFFEDLVSELNKRFSKEYIPKYSGNHIIQEFIKQNKEYDCRVCIVNGEFSHSTKRSLLSTNGEEKWLASSSRGSVEKTHIPSNKEIDIAIKASQSIGANFNEVDLAFSHKGLFIIENNPTPNYVEADRERVSRFVSCLLNNVGGIIKK